MMQYVPRDYQVEAIGAGVDFLKGKSKHNGIEIIPTGGGKSVIIGLITKELQEKTLILQPSQEILIHNYNKFRSYGYYASVYSASLGMKAISKVVFATIGSIVEKAEKFKDFKYILVDEVHLVNSKKGMYNDFFTANSKSRIMGFTATPYRLASAGDHMSELRFITRSSPRYFSKVVYYVQNKTLFDAGWLANLEYFQIGNFDSVRIKLNSTGADFDDEAIKQYHMRINLNGIVARSLARLLEVGRKSILVFVRYIAEAEAICKLFPEARMVTGKTPQKERVKLLDDFTSGRTRVMVNCGVLTTGFDYPELDTVLIARETLSLAVYYQMIGRVIRIHPTKKTAWVVDCCGNYRLFGKVEDLVIEQDEKDRFFISSNGIQLTNTPFNKRNNVVDPKIFK